MEINTKFNHGEKVFAIVDNKITEVRIHQITIIARKNIDIWYEINWDGGKYDKRRQDEVYKTKNDIIK